MNAAINRSERRAFVAQFRTRRLFCTVCLVLLALLPFLTALGAVLFKPGNPGVAVPLRIAAVLCGVCGLSLLTLSLIPFLRLPSLAKTFTVAELKRTERFLGFGGVVLCLISLGLSFQKLPGVLRIPPSFEMPLIPEVTLAIGIVALLAIGLLWEFVHPLRGGMCRFMRAVRFWLTALAVGFTLLQLIHSPETLLPEAVLYELAALSVIALLTAAYSSFLTPLEHTLQYEIISVEPIGSDAVEVTFERESERPVTDYLPGQSVGVSFSGGTYSVKPINYLSAAAGNQLRIVFPSKDGTTALDGVGKPGDEATFGFGRGTFDYRRLGTDGFVLIVDGFGISAAVAILRALAATRDRREVTLMIGASEMASGWFDEELNGLKERLRLKVAGGEGDVPLGLIGENLNRFDYFVCGSKSLIAEARKALKAAKIPSTNQWYEEI